MKQKIWKRIFAVAKINGDGCEVFGSLSEENILWKNSLDVIFTPSRYSLP